MTLCLGKLPARPGAVKLSFSDYANVSRMPAPPTNFGHEALIKSWGVLGNDQVGDCYIAGAMHEARLWNAEAGVTVPFSTQTAINYYSELTGYDPNDPTTDQGTDVAQALSLRRHVGIPDDTGKRHKIGAYVALEPGNIDQLRYAAFYFDGVGIGVQFPQQWMEIFARGGRTWPALANPEYVGGHYITAVAWRDNKPVIVTWGKTVELAMGGYTQTCDEAYAYLTVEKLVKGVDLEGLNLAKLTDDIKQLRSIR